MSFAMHNTRRHNTATLGAVAAIHAIAIYGLVTGLAGHFLTPPAIGPLVADNIPLTQPPTPEPTAKPDDRLKPTHNDTTTTIPTKTTDVLIPSGGVTLPPYNPGTILDESGGLTLPKTPQMPVRGAVPRGQPGAWATPDDYPAADLRREHEGTARFSLAIGTDGRVSGCTILASSGWPGLDAATCNLISKRARFNPATNEDGQPMIGSYTGSIRWVIPR